VLYSLPKTSRKLNKTLRNTDAAASVGEVLCQPTDFFVLEYSLKGKVTMIETRCYGYLHFYSTFDSNSSLLIVPGGVETCIVWIRASRYITL
jgi:hypothetical protein